MRRQPALTFSGALKIFGKHDPDTIAKLDKSLGGVILAAGAGAGIATIGGAALAPLGLLAALWGWVDQKNESVSLLRALVGGVSARLGRTKGFERRDLIASAHSIIVCAAFFEILDDATGKSVKKYTIAEIERDMLNVDARKHGTRSYFETLYTLEIPAPSASFGFHENLDRVKGWIEELMAKAIDFLNEFNAGRQIANTLKISHQFVTLVIERYKSHYLKLAEQVPEFLIWATFGEHAATREQIRTHDLALRRALGTHGEALARVEALLNLVADRGVEIGRHRESLDNANKGALDQPIVSGDAERYDTEVIFPSIREAFLTPSYRIAHNARGAQPADEHWWASQVGARDLEVTIAAYLTSADATRLPLLLLGHPGAGKSILTKVLAARLPSTDYTVVRVPLRNIGAGSPIIDQIQQALDAATNGRVKWHPLTDECANTVLVVLLDGLDELLQATTFDRSAYLREAMEFQRIEGEQGRPVAVIVTSRTVVAERVNIPDDATIIKLDEFDDRQIEQWLDIWHVANSTEIVAGKVRKLTLEEVRHQTHLARQPLLLLMLALYASDPKNPKLDESISTSALYARIFDNFARREVLKRARKPLRGKDLDAKVADQIFRLSVAALAMFNRGVQHLREIDLRADLAALSRHGEVTEGEGKLLLGAFYFVHAPEALVLTKERSYEFLHATFGEYLVARHVMEELAEVADVAYGGNRRDRTPNDEMLFALLCHQAWMVRPSIVAFAGEIFASMLPDEQANIRRVLAELIQSYRQRKRSPELDDYRPMPVDYVRQLASYSANLVTLATAFAGKDEGVALMGLFGNAEQDAQARWRSTLSLWRAGLDRDNWQAVIHSLELQPDFALTRFNQGWGSYVHGTDEFWVAVLSGDSHHAQRIRQGLGMLDGTYSR